MKKIVLFALTFALLSETILAQTTKSKKKNSYKKAVAQKQKSTLINNNSTNTVSLTNTSINAGYGPASRNRLSIADPTINALNERASGADVRLNSSGILGMPKGTYGFANGKILLRTTTATSPGTGYGSGAVATGTSINSIGTSEATIGVNGKSPYAGPWLWGSQQPVYAVPSKAATASTPNKQ